MKFRTSMICVVVVRQNARTKDAPDSERFEARGDLRDDTSTSQQVLIAAHRPGLLENRAEGSTHGVQTARSSPTELIMDECVDALSCHGVAVMQSAQSG
jgi:hypothetical protein